MGRVLKLVSVRDVKANTFEVPGLVNTLAEAERALRSAANTEGNKVKMYPNDYDMYLLGEMDVETGVVTPRNIPELICNAASLVEARH